MFSNDRCSVCSDIWRLPSLITCQSSPTSLGPAQQWKQSVKTFHQLVSVTSSVHCLFSWPATGDCGWSERPRWPTHSWQGWWWTVFGRSCICRPCPPSCGWWIEVRCLWIWWSPPSLESTRKWPWTDIRHHGTGWLGGWTRTSPAPERTDTRRYFPLILFSV